MKNNIQRYMTARRDPARAVVEYLKDLDVVVERMVGKAISEMTEQKKSEFGSTLDQLKASIPEISKTLSTEIAERVYRDEAKFKGKKGDQGESVRGPRGRQGKPGVGGKPGRTPVPGLDFPTHREIEKMVERLTKEKAPNKAELASLVSRLIEKILKKSVKKLDFAAIARGIETLPLKERLDYYHGLKNQPDLSPKSELVRGGERGGGGSSGGVSGSGTANEITYWFDDGTLGSLSTATYPSLTELTYLKGVDSNIQDQIDAITGSSGIDESLAIAYAVSL